MPTLEEAIEIFEQLSKLCETNGIHDSQELYKQYAEWLRELQERRKAPELIRYKDCKYNVSSHKCLHPESFFLVPDDDFYCEYAERRTDGQSESD